MYGPLGHKLAIQKNGRRRTSVKKNISNLTPAGRKLRVPQPGAVHGIGR
jgi:hypothetical protein